MTLFHVPMARFLPLLLVVASVVAADLPRNTTRYDFSAVPAVMASEISAGSPAGFTLMIVKDDQVVFEQAVGNKTLASVLLLASASKMPSSTVIMDLVARGLLGLDDRVADHLTFWPQSAADPKSQITIRQCLSCTSGLSADDTYEGDNSLTLDTAVQGIATLPLNFTPGTQFGYTGNGFHIAACVAEHVSGRTWAQLVQDDWITPLSLSTFTYGASANPRVAGGASCNTDDYARILSTHLARGRYQGMRVFAASMVDRMQEDERVNQGITTVFASPAPSPDWHYGLSWWITPYTTSAPEEISDQGAFGATPWIDLGRGYAAVMLMQSSGPIGRRIWDALRPVINAAIDAEHDLILVRPATAVLLGSTATLSARGGAWGPESAITYTWSVVSAPSGAPTPTFTGNGGNDAQQCPVTLTRAGTWTLRVTIAAPSASGQSLTSTVTVVVPATATSIAITPDPASVAAGATIALSANVLDQFGQALTPQPTIAWSSTAGSITSDGQLTAPNAPGTLTVTASAMGLSADRSVTVTNRAPSVVSGIPPQSATVGTAYSFVFAAGTFSDADGDALTYSASGMPGGISFTPATRTFAGTPSAAGSSTVTVTASDGHGGSANTVFLLMVGSVAPPATPSTPPSITNPTSPTPTISGTASIGETIHIYDGASEIGTVTTTTGSWSFTPSIPLSAGTHTISYTVSVGSGPQSSGSPGVTIVVDGVPPPTGSTSDSSSSGCGGGSGVSVLLLIALCSLSCARSQRTPSGRNRGRRMESSVHARHLQPDRDEE